MIASNRLKSVSRINASLEDGLSLPSCIQERLAKGHTYLNRSWLVSPLRPNVTLADTLPIYVISYAGALLTRQPFIREELQSAGVSATLVTGFDGKALTDEDARCWLSEAGMKDKDLSIPGRGYMSQTLKILAALYDIVAKDLPWGMTMDDDKFFDTANFKTLINEVLAEAPPGWHVIQFSKCFEGMRPQTWTGCAAHSKWLWRCTWPRCCDNNLVSQEGARMLLSLIPIDTVMDWLLWKPQGLQILWVEPYQSWEDKGRFPSVSNMDANRNTSESITKN